MLAKACGSLSVARALPAEDAQQLLATLGYQQTVAALSEQLGQLMGNAPDNRDTSDAGRRMLSDWQESYEELMLSLVQEDCCHRLPLDSRFGEQYNPPALEHWNYAPGVAGG